MFEGFSVAMVTPFRDGALDLAGIERLVTHLIEGGVDGIVALGSTGEAATQSPGERRTVLREILRVAHGRVWVVAGTGTNDTAESIELTRMAKQEGAHGAMVVTPFYNKPTPAGQIAHLRAIAEAVPFDYITYNVPGRTGTNTLPETVLALARIPGVKAVKEASGSVDQASAILCGDPHLTVLSGDDSLTVPLMAIGAKGVISVVGHVATKEMTQMVAAAAAGRTDEAAAWHRRLFPLMRVMFLESNPSPVKDALAQIGICGAEVRLPLVGVSGATHDAIAAQLAAAGIGSQPATA